MGTLLERIGIPYHIFERAAKVKPLGTLSFMPRYRLAICVLFMAQKTDKAIRP